jgi:16S rRNA (cytosine967-C5)-methyltransferase
MCLALEAVLGRRNPENRWRLRQESLGEYINIQRSLMKEAWDAVKIGGRVAYMTCSVFKDENESQIEWFLIEHENANLILLFVSKASNN